MDTICNKKGWKQIECGGKSIYVSVIKEAEFHDIVFESLQVHVHDETLTTPYIQGVVHAINVALVPDLEMLRLFCANTAAPLASPVGENVSTMLVV